MNKHRIFVVEDDRSISGLYEIAFDKDEFEVVCFDKAEGMFDAFEKEETCDIIILDLMLPGMSGLDALKILKTNEKTKSVPVIIVSAKGDEKDKVEGLNLGADDYIAKPFGMLELIARVKANIRKSAMGGGEIISIGEITINNSEHEVTVRYQGKNSERGMGLRLRGRNAHAGYAYKIAAQQDSAVYPRAVHPHRKRRGLQIFQIG